MESHLKVRFQLIFNERYFDSLGVGNDIEHLKLLYDFLVLYDFLRLIFIY